MRPDGYCSHNLAYVIAKHGSIILENKEKPGVEGPSVVSACFGMSFRNG
jgi:hypothetical protein